MSGTPEPQDVSGIRQPHDGSGTAQPHDGRIELLEHDEAIERRLVWKGLLSLVVVVALAYVRQRWWL